MALGQVVANAATQFVGLLKRELADSIKQAADYEKAVKGLNAAFEISGRTMPGMTENLTKYAAELEKLGLAEDDEILRSESLLLQLTRLDQEGIKTATRGAIGLASVFGMDLQSATTMVAKGMEGNFMALNKLIPAIRNATSEEEKRAAMMKAFDGLYARAIADTDTYAGQVKKMALEWKNAKQELGGAILETGMLQEAMHGLTVIMKGLTGGAAREQKAATLEQIEANNKAGKSLEEMGKRLGYNRTELAGLRTQYNLTSVQLLSWVKDGLIGRKEAETLNRVLAEEAAALAKTKAGFTETGADIKEKFVVPLTEAQRALEEDIRWLRMFGVNIEGPVSKAIQTLGDVIGGDLGKSIDFVEPKADGLFEGLVLGSTKAAKGVNKLEKEMEDFKKTVASIKAVSDVVFGGMDEIFQQATTNREIAIENEYKKRLDYINATVTDETEKQKAIMALEAEYEIKRTSARRAGAKQAKGIAMMEAVINTASAVAEALPNLFLAALVGAMGAVQIGLIAKQPIPLAQGAVFSKRTRLVSSAGTAYDVGEGGESEILAPESKIRKAVREAGGGGGVTINGPIIATSAALTEAMCKQAARWMFNAVESERRLGRRS